MSYRRPRRIRWGSAALEVDPASTISTPAHRRSQDARLISSSRGCRVVSHCSSALDALGCRDRSARRRGCCRPCCSPGGQPSRATRDLVVPPGDAGSRRTPFPRGSLLGARGRPVAGSSPRAPISRADMADLRLPAARPHHRLASGRRLSSGPRAPRRVPRRNARSDVHLATRSSRSIHSVHGGSCGSVTRHDSTANRTGSAGARVRACM